jgi:hypothetical protein
MPFACLLELLPKGAMERLMSIIKCFCLTEITPFQIYIPEKNRKQNSTLFRSDVIAY